MLNQIIQDFAEILNEYNTLEELQTELAKGYNEFDGSFFSVTATQWKYAYRLAIRWKKTGITSSSCDNINIAHISHDALVNSWFVSEV